MPTIPQLPAASSVTGSDLLPVSQSNVAKRVTIANLFLNPSVGQSILIGTGTTTGLTYQFQSAINIDPGSAASVERRHMFNTTLTYASNSTNIWEGVTAFTYVSGPGQANGEINGFHSYFQFNSGSTAKTVEGFEASMLNNGSSNDYAGLLVIPQNGAAGTQTGPGSWNGVRCYLTNSNSTAASIASYAAFETGQMAGGGSLPTYYYSILNRDADASINTAGGLVIGSLSTASSWGNKYGLWVFGSDNSSGTYSSVFKNLAGTNAFLISNDAKGHFPNGFDATSFTLNGVNATAGTYTLTVKNSTPTNLFLVENNGTVYWPIAGQGGPTTLTGATSSGGAYALTVKNSSATNLLLVENNGTVQWPLGGTGGPVTLTGTDNSSGSYTLTVKNLAGSNTLLVTNDGSLRALVSLVLNGSQVVGVRDTGWTAMTGSSNKATSYDTSTVTLAQLAGRVMALQASLTTHGLIGA